MDVKEALKWTNLIIVYVLSHWFREKVGRDNAKF